MSKRLTIVSVVGARPQFVKLAPICRAVERVTGIRHLIVHTGQHYDVRLSGELFRQLEIRDPDVNLGVASGSHARQTAKAMVGVEAYLQETAVDAVFTYGDTNSTLAATLAATKLHVPVAHIEAGLRSFNRRMPEETNRLVADHCGDRLYAPTPQAMVNLENEGLEARSVLTGDVMLDAVQFNHQLALKNSEILQQLELQKGDFGFVTVHRPVNTDGDSLEALLASLAELACTHFPLVFPVHPRTRRVLDEINFVAPQGLFLLDPVPYLDCLRLCEAARIVITDSGGVQKEAAFMHTPCLTLRDETEWTETLEIGINRLVGNHGSNLSPAFEEMMGVGDLFNEKTVARIEFHFGGGNAAETIVRDALEWLAE